MSPLRKVNKNLSAMVICARWILVEKGGCSLIIPSVFISPFNAHS